MKSKKRIIRRRKNIVSNTPAPLPDPIDKLRDNQKQVIKECLALGSGGLYCVMGYGKTRMSLVLAHLYNKDGGISLIVCAKSLIGIWISELDEIYPWMKYEVLHSEFCKVKEWVPKSTTKIVITTPGMLTSVYTKRDLSLICTKKYSPVFCTPMKFYLPSKNPILKEKKGVELLFSQKLKSLHVDEVQGYTNVETKSCQALMCLVAEHTWLCSGTIIEEPVAKRILGYFCLLDLPDTPRCMLDTKKYLRGGKTWIPKVDWLGHKIGTFKGLEKSMVIRKVNTAFVPPKVNDYVSCNILTENESKFYYMLSTIFKRLYLLNKKLIKEGRHTEAVEIRGGMLSMITYIRMSLVIPRQTLKKIYYKEEGTERKNKEVLKMLMEEMKTFKLYEWMNGEEESTRIKNIHKETTKYPNEKIVIFTSFRESLNAIKAYLEKNTDREIITITSKMKTIRRLEVVNNFSDTKNGILLLTYSIGANGLNLQKASVVMLAGLWWNSGKTDQAKYRIYRIGQEAKMIYVIYLTSGTMIEQAILEKHHLKNKIISEIMKGNIKTKISTFSFEDIFRLVDMDDNKILFESIYIRRFRKKYEEYLKRKRGRDKTGWEKEREKYRRGEREQEREREQGKWDKQQEQRRKKQEQANLSPKELLAKYNIYNVQDWRRWLLKYHPDKNPNTDIELVQLINMAANIIYRK